MGSSHEYQMVGQKAAAVPASRWNELMWSELEQGDRHAWLLRHGLLALHGKPIWMTAANVVQKSKPPIVRLVRRQQQCVGWLVGCKNVLFLVTAGYVTNNV